MKVIFDKIDKFNKSHSVTISKFFCIKLKKQQKWDTK